MAVGALEGDAVAPLLALALDDPVLKVAHEALVVGDDGSLAVGEVVEVEAEVVEAASVVFAVAFAAGGSEFALVEGLVGHGGEVAVGEGVSVVGSEFGDVHRDGGIFQLVHEVVAVDGVVLCLPGTGLTGPH